MNDGKQRMYLVTFDRQTGKLDIDRAFRDEGASSPGITFARDQWPHGAAGAAMAHGSVFARP